VPFDVLYTSPLRRAVETARAIAAHHPGVPVRTLDDLEEMAWGIYEGALPSDGVQEAFVDLYARWREGDFGYRIDGGESILDVQDRALRALDHVLARHQGETVAVVTHGRFLRVLLATQLREYGLERMHEIAHANTCVNYITCCEGHFVARLLNCTAHLDETVLSGVG
jgi:broad specificity phosphatase PhoE